ncbi:hypothetical protein COHA_007597 [Chlorella ohadii]|uniref:Uncharacterized protein n=1 Tax=Chlorella ohadii TaxID=2649997 RepID=A0AAD5DLS6_9CHLO|nr:hypothetical protein COHA_007597 [Chlorella ohadii]
MGFEIDDSKFAIHATVAPKHYNELYMSKDLPVNEPMTRWFGLALATCGGGIPITLSAGDYSDKKPVKDALKASGAGWTTALVTTLYNAHEGHQKKEPAYASAVGMAAMAALCLWRGFREDE